MRARGLQPLFGEMYWRRSDFQPTKRLARLGDVQLRDGHDMNSGTCQDQVPGCTLENDEHQPACTLGSTQIFVERGIFVKEVGAFEQDPETIILEVSETVGATLNEFHLAVKAFRDAVASGKAPHANDGHKPLAECISKAAPNEMGGVA